MPIAFAIAAILVSLFMGAGSAISTVPNQTNSASVAATPPPSGDNTGGIGI